MSARKAAGKRARMDTHPGRSRTPGAASGKGKAAHARSGPETVLLGKEARLGIDLSGRCRLGTYLQIDDAVVRADSGAEGVEVLCIGEAGRKHAWLAGRMWRLVHPGQDEYTAGVFQNPGRGYFVRCMAGVKARWPLQACLFIASEGAVQKVHNVVIAEEGSELNLITGCGSAAKARTTLHAGVTEVYVGRGAVVTSTMIHNWSEDAVVRPRAAVMVEEGGLFVSNYVSLAPLGSLQMCPDITCGAGGAAAKVSNVLWAHPGSALDVGTRVRLQAAGCSAEVISRAVTTGGHVTARGRLEGEVEGVRAHLECRGLILGGGGQIRAVPELLGLSRGVEMTHEAAVGKVAEEEILYLMTRGLTEEQATEALVSGFLDVKLEGLPEVLEREIERAVRSVDLRGL